MPPEMHAHTHACARALWTQLTLTAPPTIDRSCVKFKWTVVLPNGGTTPIDERNHKCNYENKCKDGDRVRALSLETLARAIFRPAPPPSTPIGTTGPGRGVRATTARARGRAEPEGIQFDARWNAKISGPYYIHATLMAARPITLHRTPVDLDHTHGVPCTRSLSVPIARAQHRHSAAPEGALSNASRKGQERPRTVPASQASCSASAPRDRCCSCRRRSREHKNKVKDESLAIHSTLL